jgi:bifunctional DNA-binding transcriptional regulator/antitoxin component of YhaV-PrlF toxin-antitoxin module
MEEEVTSKGQITIPIHLRTRLHLKAGVVLEFDETAPFLKAAKTIPPTAWEEFGRLATNPWEGMDIFGIMDELRGPVELPPQLRD